MVVIFYFIYCLFVLVLKEISKLKKRVAIKNDETILMCFCFYEMVNVRLKRFHMPQPSTQKHF